ncbi:MAG TPA: glutamate--tRNA ligase [Symbiobacteriaceae bacterium]|nr:glutamate--tRNA ligase [Symbiobacteriaceae bacterium]
MVRVRIAPSPTGNCHVGTARTALFNLLLARQAGGTMILRIDDTDRRRSTQESEDGVLAGLKWLGLTWDEGPGVGGDYGPYWQSERIELYRKYAQELVERDLAYPCYCTESDLAAERAAQEAAHLPPMYSGRCAHLSAEERAARAAVNPTPTIRLRMPATDLSFPDLIRGPITVAAGVVGDFVIIKSDGMPTYNYATVIDEHLMAITHVVRGQEHISNTFPQLAIYRALGWEPPAFGHLNLMLNPDKTKISKRKNAVYIGEFQAMGYLPEALINFLALQGWSPGDTQEVFTFDELVAAFSLERCTPANAVFDMQKLEWLNGVHIRRLPPAELARRVVPYLAGAGLIPVEPDATTLERLTALMPLVQERLHRLDEAPAMLDFFFRAPAAYEVSPDPAACAAAAARLATLEHWTHDGIEHALRALAVELGKKPGELFMPLRMAVSGRKVTPPLFESLVILGREETLARLAI